MTSLKVYFWILWSPVGTMFGLVTFFFYFFYWSIVNLQCCVTFCYIAKYIYIYIYLHHFRSVTQSCPTLWPHGLQHTRPPSPSPTPGVYPKASPLSPSCHPTISPLSASPPTFSLPQHPGLFKWVSSSHQVAKILEFQLQYQSFQWILRTIVL